MYPCGDLTPIWADMAGVGYNWMPIVALPFGQIPRVESSGQGPCGQSRRGQSHRARTHQETLSVSHICVETPRRLDSAFRKSGQDWFDGKRIHQHSRAHRGHGFYRRCICPNETPLLSCNSAYSVFALAACFIGGEIGWEHLFHTYFPCLLEKHSTTYFQGGWLLHFITNRLGRD